MKKEELIRISKYFDLIVDLDRWDEKGWIRFKLNKNLSFNDLIIFKDYYENDVIEAFQNYLQAYGEWTFKLKIKTLFA
jgi:hypothetical protein